MLRRLIRMRVLDAARLQGRFVVVLDATGHLAFRQRHCPHCLVYRHATHTVYLHQVLEAKLLGPAGLALSMASEFIENSDSNAALSGEAHKQDCELKTRPPVASPNSVGISRNCGSVFPVTVSMPVAGLCNWPRTITATTCSPSSQATCLPSGRTFRVS